MHKNPTGRKSLVALMAVMRMFGTAHSSFIPNNSSSVHVRDAVTNKNVEPGSQIEKRRTASDVNPYKHQRKYYRNQRQYRKWLKQVPQFRNSKKCRL